MLRSVLVDDFDAFVRLEDDWNALARSVATSRYSQSFEWCRMGWETRDSAPGDGLVCATVWSGDRLVGIWPFQRNALGAVTRLEPLGCGTHEEYGDPLVATDIDAAGIDAAAVCRALLDLLRPVADVIEVPFIRKDSPMQRALRRTGLFRIAIQMDAYAVEAKGVQSFPALLQTYSSNFRANLKQKRKRLEKQGVLRFELPEDLQASAETIDWVLAEKRRWLQRQEKSSPWLQKDEIRHFLLAAALRRGDFGRIGFFRLTLDGRPIAAFLATIDQTRIEMQVTCFDPDYGRFSPGMLLIEDVTRWGFERGMSFDMRPLKMDYKERWANVTARHLSYRVPLTLRGAKALLRDFLSFSFSQGARMLLNDEQRAAIKRALKRILALRHGLRPAATEPALRPLPED